MVSLENHISSVIFLQSINFMFNGDAPVGVKHSFKKLAAFGYRKNICKKLSMGSRKFIKINIMI